MRPARDDTGLEVVADTPESSPRFGDEYHLRRVADGHGLGPQSQLGEELRDAGSEAAAGRVRQVELPCGGPSHGRIRACRRRENRPGAGLQVEAKAMLASPVRGGGDEVARIPGG